MTLALLPALLVGVVSTWAAINDSWHWLRVRHAFGSTYADLRQVTATASCIARNPDWSMASATCDPFGRSFNYPSFWARGFATLGLDEGSTRAIAWTFLALFVSAIFVISLLSIWSVRPRLPLAGVVLAACAPPTWLALERGNIDVVVFAIVVWAALASLLDRRSISAVLLAIATLAKLFPVGAALIPLRDRRQDPRSLWIFAGLTVLGIAFMVNELPLINQRTPQPTGAAFGAALLFQVALNRLDSPFPSLAPRVLGVLLFATVLLTYRAMLRVRLPRIDRSITDAVDDITRDRISSTLVLAGGGPLIVAYLAGTNFDYRLIFAIPLVAGLCRRQTPRVDPCNLLMGAVLLQMWLSYPMPVPIQLVSDLMWVVVAPAVGLLLLRLTLPESVEAHES